MNKAIIAIDSFKGCLTSEEAGSAVMEGIKTIFPDCETLLFPIADGGEGMLDILTSATKGKYRTLPAHGPLMELVQGRYGISGDGQTALIEMAAVSGLPLVPEDKRNPMLTTTYGTGELILDALEQGCRHFIVGIGGSATNDAGLGMLQALGFRFLDKRGNLLGTGGRIMSQVASIDTSAVHPALKEARFTIACDVRNPFCGSDGAAYVLRFAKGSRCQDGQRTGYRYAGTFTGYPVDYWQRHFGYPRSRGSRRNGRRFPCVPECRVETGYPPDARRAGLR